MTSITKPNDLSITLEFSGGAELLFEKKKFELNLPGEQEWTLKLLLFWIRDNLLRDRPELFLLRDTVRPGILVLVNDEDWELLSLRHEIEFVYYFQLYYEKWPRRVHIKT